MADFIALSQADLKVLKDHIELIKKTHHSTMNRPNVEWVDNQTAGVFVVRVPDDGLSARVGYAPGGGIECPAFFFTEGNDELEYCGIDPVVYNLSLNEITGGTYIAVVKDKAGVWWAAGAPQSVCTEITFTESETYCDDLVGTSGAVWYRSRTITLNIVDGCLEKTAGAWEYLECPPVAGTATSTSTSTAVAGTSTDEAHCCGGHGFGLLPDSLSVTWSSFVNCSCLSSLSGGLTSITWYGTGDYWTGVYVYDGMKVFNMSLSCDISGVWTLAWTADEMGIPIGSGSSTASPSSCTPFSQTFSLDVTGVCGGGAASVVATITL